MKLKFLTLLISIAFVFSACEQELDSELNQLISNEKSISELELKGTIELPEYMPLNYVLEWVKEKVTPEEYELWKTMSSKFEIDYSFLKHPLSLKRKKHIYKGVRRICNNISTGKINQPMGTFLFLNEQDAIDNFNIEKLSFDEGSFDSCSRTLRIYTHSSLDINVDATLSYDYNSTTEKVRNPSLGSAWADDGGKYSASVNGGGNATYNSDDGYISVSYSGTLTYYPNDESKTSSSVSINYSNSIYP